MLLGMNVVLFWARMLWIWICSNVCSLRTESGRLFSAGRFLQPRRVIVSYKISLLRVLSANQAWSVDSSDEIRQRRFRRVQAFGVERGWGGKGVPEMKV